MSVFHNNALIGSGAGAAADTGANITKSLRFNSGDSPYLNRTPSSAGNRRTFTWAGWVKNTTDGTFRALIEGYAGSEAASVRTSFQLNNANKLHILFDNTASGDLLTTAVFRDPSAWYHVVLAIDTTQATASNRVKIYVNGTQITEFDNENYPAQNYQTGINNNQPHYINRVADPLYGSWYAADLYLVDGSQLDPTSFGSFDSNGVWQAAAYSGTFGTNGFHLLDFENESTLGHDSSGNENDFTTNNITSGPEKATGYVTGSGTPANASGSGGWSQAFDGSTGTLIYNSNGSTTTTFNLHQSLAWTSKIRIYAGQNATSGTNIIANGTNLSSSHTWPLTGGWQEVTSSLTSPLTSLGLTSVGGQSSNIRAVEIDDTIVVQVKGQDVDDLFDVPTNGDQSDTGAGGEVSGNYATFNPLSNGLGCTVSQGNLRLSGSATSSARINGTIGVSSGKWYFEVIYTASDDYTLAGVGQDSITDQYPGQDAKSYAFDFFQSKKYNNNSQVSYGSSLSAGDIFMCALDLDNNKIFFGKNGTFFDSGNPATGTNPAYTVTAGTYHIIGRLNPSGFSSGNAILDLNAGQRAYSYSAPSGFKSWNTTNLPTPTIADGSAHFETVLWDGDSASPRSITGLEFSPDIVYMRPRNYNRNNTFYDTIRGAGKKLYSDATDAEDSGTGRGYLSSFDSNGFTLTDGSAGDQDTNNSSYNYVAWAWNAGANSNKTYTVKVVSDSGNKYRFDDFGTSAVTLDLAEGSTYVFDQSDSSNSGHPLRFSTTSDGTHNSGSEYTTGVTTTGTPGSAGAKTTIVVAASAPTLYYYCSVHSGMGGQANTNSTAGASNFDGTIQATVKANPEAGFSIASWTGTGANGSIGHGLNSKPQVVISKNRTDSSTPWVVDIIGVLSSGTDYMLLNSTQASNTGGSTADSSVVNILSFNDRNGSSDAMIAYCFTSVAGYSAFGSYNGSSDGPFQYLGFRPAWLLIKKTTGADNWILYDTKRNTHNVSNKIFSPNTSSVEDTTSTAYTNLDILSNGFKVRATTGGTIGGGGSSSSDSYLYAAFSENAFSLNSGLAR